MADKPITAPATIARSATSRAVGFFVLWIILSNGVPGDLVAGGVAALVAVAVSLRLLPPTRSRIRVIPLAELVLRFFGKSVIAGVDVAHRALDPRLPVNPGLLRYPVRLQHGAARNTFTMLTGLLPGTVPIDSDEHAQLIIHCLDVGRPNAEELATEEALLLRVMGRIPGNG